MKMRITMEQLEQLTEDQKSRLADFWTPAKYDVVQASVCKNADTEEYDKFEFVIGNVVIDEYYRMFLFDIKAVSEKGQNQEEETEDQDEISEDESEEDGEYEEYEEESEDSFMNFSYSRPICFNKKQCLPLLNIGQLIDMIQKTGLKNGDFYLLAGTADLACIMGKDSGEWNTYGFEHQNDELCDVLWELLKTEL